MRHDLVSLTVVVVVVVVVCLTRKTSGVHNLLPT